jgi:hypothetical protein
MPDESTPRPLCPGNGNDRIYTPPRLAEMIVSHFKPSGAMCEPCRGDGSFSRLMPDCDWWEIDEGRDFFDLQIGHYDWIITNPPFSMLYEFAEHAFRFADNVVFLAPLNQTIGLKARNVVADKASMHVREIMLVDTPPPPWPQSGFQLVATYWRRGLEAPGTIRWTDRRGHIQYSQSPRRASSRRKKQSSTPQPFENSEFILMP